MSERRCTGTTAKGKPCQGKPMKDRDVCKQHSGDANVGQRGKFTEEIRASILTALAAGCYAEDAFAAAGIASATYYSWLERGEADLERAIESDYAEFSEAVTRARGNARLAAVGYLRQAMRDDWRAALAFLERTDPAKWGRTDRVQHSGQIKTGGGVDLTQLSDEDLSELEAIVARAVDEG